MRIKIDAPNWLIALFAIIWLFLMFFATGFWRTIGYSPSDEWQRIYNEDYHFSFEYPSKWLADVYGERGYRGAEHIKATISRPIIEGFSIQVLYQDYEDPALTQVATWGEYRMKRLNSDEYRSRMLYREIEFGEYFILDEKVLVRRFGNPERMYEHVYVARPNDMLIIQLTADADDFDKYLEDFYKIVDSFRTMDDPSIK